MILGNIARVSYAERLRINDNYFHHQSKGCIASDSKHLIIVTGLPGSGKSSLVNKTKSENSNYIAIGSDDFYALHPRIFELYQANPEVLNSKEHSGQENPDVEQFVSDSFEYTLAEALSKKYNIILDIQPNESVIDYVDIAESMGYQVDVKFIVAPKKEIDLGILSRHIRGTYNFEQALERKRPQDGKNLPHHYSQMRVSPEYMGDIKNLLLELQDRGVGLEVLNSRNDELLYDRNSSENAAEVFESELKRPLREDERLRQKSEICRTKLLINRLKLRTDDWKTTDRKYSSSYESKTGHKKYYQKVLDGVER